mmetsp:Transcript_19685/g.40961  ORF Transcript_19685/g.40961 Transcript_19685/m.40961 type:complete len:308 (-) Transcript_19685:886-1809(-)
MISCWNSKMRMKWLLLHPKDHHNLRKNPRWKFQGRLSKIWSVGQLRRRKDRLPKMLKSRRKRKPRYNPHQSHQRHPRLQFLLPRPLLRRLPHHHHRPPPYHYRQSKNLLLQGKLLPALRRPQRLPNQDGTLDPKYLLSQILSRLQKVLLKELVDHILRVMCRLQLRANPFSEQVFKVRECRKARNLQPAAANHLRRRVQSQHLRKPTFVLNSLMVNIACTVGRNHHGLKTTKISLLRQREKKFDKEATWLARSLTLAVRMILLVPVMLLGRLLRVMKSQRKKFCDDLLAERLETVLLPVRCMVDTVG